MADLAQCGRCRAFTLLDKTGPVPLAVDFMAAGRDGYIAALLGRVSLYGVQKRQNGATRLLAPSAGNAPPTFTPEGVQTGTPPLHVEHSCPASVQRVVKATSPKDSAPATPGAPPDGSRPLAAHVYAARGPATRSPAATATHHLSDAYPVCGTCRRNVKSGEMYTGVQHGNKWIWAEHERCT